VQSTNPVGQKIPNEINLYDMSGNVWEWCNDFHSSSYYQQSPTDDPVGPANGTQHVKRGGGFLIAENCRIHGRGRNTADFSSEDLGLRLARTKLF